MISRLNPNSVLWILVSLLLACAPSETSSPEEGEDKPDRNMGGLGVPRGVVSTSDDLLPGYILYELPNSVSSYLVNREGEVIHEWKGYYETAMSYLTDSGSVVRVVRDPDFTFPFFGGNAGRIEEISWEGDILWEYELSDETHLSHHDIALMPNGNVLIISLDEKAKEQALARGRHPDYTPESGIWPDMIVEVEPIKPRGGKIVWEWHSWDHMIQDTDPELPNYGDPAVHPELLDINASAEKPDPMHPDTLKMRKRERKSWNATVDNEWSDIHHVNAINYNPVLDQIAISSYMLNEIFIIDHSTTTAEAAGHTGGKHGKGGDFLYRWGNPANYDRGDTTDQQLFHQHDVRWIENGKPGAGNLTVYNNNIPMGPDSMNYSAVYELVPPQDSEGRYLIASDQPFGPQNPEWTYVAPDTVSFYSSFISGAHRMHNGNTFITAGGAGRSFEVDPAGDIVWEYWNPFRGGMTRVDGSPKTGGGVPYMTFRQTFIPADHPGLAGRELGPVDPQPEPHITEMEENKD